MRILLDTAYIYDLMDKPGKLQVSERRIFSAAGTQLYVSAVSVWEMRLKHAARYPSGERKSRFSPQDVMTALGDQELVFLPMSMRHAAEALETPLDHKDPFDELLLVQAQEEGLKLLTSDKRLAGHPLACTVDELG